MNSQASLTQDAVHFGGSTRSDAKWKVGGLLGMALLALAACKPDDKSAKPDPEPRAPITRPEPQPETPREEPRSIPKAVYGPYTEGRFNGSAVALQYLLIEKQVPPEIMANIERLPQAMLELRALSANTEHPFFASNLEETSLQIDDNWLNEKTPEGKHVKSYEHQALSMSVLGYYAEMNGIHSLKAEDLPPEIQAKFTEVQALYKENLEPILMRAVQNPRPIPPGWGQGAPLHYE